MKNRSSFALMLSSVLFIHLLGGLGEAFAQNPGSLDLSFNPGTGATGGASYNTILTTAMQPDGKVIIGGSFTSYNGTAMNRIARLNADGTLDGSFTVGTGVNGGVETTAIQPDGRIIIGGWFTSYNGTAMNRIARLNADGTLDSSFTVGTGADGDVATTAIQPDGKIIIGGAFTSYNGTARSSIARLNADGTLDGSFTVGSGANNVVETISIQPDGKVIIGGWFTSYNGTARNFIARLNVNGTLDGSFTVGSGANNIILTTAIQPDGKIIIGGGFTSYNGTARSSIARLNADGTLDGSFTVGSGANNVVETTAIQPDGRIIIGGQFTSYNGTAMNRIARLNADGTLDGSLTVGTGADNNVLTTSIQPDGKMIIGGTFNSYNGTVINSIARLHGGGGIANPTTIAPQIVLSAGSVSTGQSITVTGASFTANDNADIGITGPGNFVFTTTQPISASGGFTYPFVTNANMPLGIYNVVVTDNATGLSTVIRTFTLLDPNVQAFHLNITSPVAGDQYTVGQSATFSFTDLMQTGNAYPINGAKRLFDYDVEISDDGGSTWNYLTTVSGEEYPNVTLTRTATFSGTAPGSHRFRVTDTYQPANTVTGDVFTVVAVTPSNIQLEKRWDRSYANQNNTLLGVAADGTARIYLAVSKIDNSVGPAISSVSVALSDNAGSTATKLGRVMAATQVSTYSSEANNATATSASTTSPITGKYWFWYVAPDDFVRTGQGDESQNSRNVTATITVNYANSTTEVLQEQIKVVRPPLMLVHGLGGGPSTWNGFRNNTLGNSVSFLNDPRFISAHAVNLYPHYSFLVNSLELVNGNNFNSPSPYYSSFQDVIRDMRAKGYAANQVDYVGHSMGGVLIRSVMDNFPTRFTRTGNHANADFKNYERGYVNKLVTISSPHNSSPLADIVDRYIGGLSLVSRGIMEGYYLTNPNAMAFSLTQPDYTNTGLFGIPTFEATPAVRNLKIDHTDGGVNHGGTNLSSHLIAADVLAGTQGFNNYAIPQSVILSYQNVVDQLDFLDRLLNITLANTQDQQLATDLAGVAGIDNIVHRAFKYVEVMANVYNLAVFIPESDLVVGVESQLADFPKLASNVSVFDNGITHCCFGARVLGQVDVGNRLMDMLNAPITSSAFANIPSTSNKTLSDAVTAPPVLSPVLSLVDTAKIEMLLPVSNAIVYVDSTLMVRVDVKDTTNLIRLDVTFQGKSYRLNKEIGVVDLPVQVSPFAFDTQLVYVEALYKYPDSAYFVFDTSSVFVTTLSTLHQIKVDPEILFLRKEETLFPRYYAIYDEFTTTVQSFSPHINATVANSAIVQFDPLTKGFLGVSDGETFATVSYEGFTDTIYLVVRGQMSPDSSVVVAIEEFQQDMENRAKPSVMAFPNPTNGVVQITSSMSDRYTLHVMSSVGQSIYRADFTGTSHQLDLTDLPSGFYLLEITDSRMRKEVFKVMRE